MERVQNLKTGQPNPHKKKGEESQQLFLDMSENCHKADCPPPQTVQTDRWIKRSTTYWERKPVMEVSMDRNTLKL